MMILGSMFLETYYGRVNASLSQCGYIGYNLEIKNPDVIHDKSYNF